MPQTSRALGAGSSCVRATRCRQSPTATPLGISSRQSSFCTGTSAWISILRSQLTSSTTPMVSSVRKIMTKKRMNRARMPKPTKIAARPKPLLPCWGLGARACNSLPESSPAPQRWQRLALAGLADPQAGQVTSGTGALRCAPRTCPAARALPSLRSAPHCLQTVAVASLRAPQ